MGSGTVYEAGVLYDGASNMCVKMVQMSSVGVSCEKMALVSCVKTWR